MGDVEEAKLDDIKDKLEEEAIKDEIEEVEEEVKEEIEEIKEEVKEELEEIKEELEEIADKPPDLIISESPPIDYDLLADKVAERLGPKEEPEAEEVEEEELAPEEDAPPGSNSFLFRKRI